VLPDKRAGIVVYCMNEECEASRGEDRELEEMGYRHVLHYPGGKQGWSRRASLWKLGGRARNVINLELSVGRELVHVLKRRCAQQQKGANACRRTSCRPG
jgi:hypothetical protein